MKKGLRYYRNIFTFGFGTIGRDMLYTLVSMFLIAYLTEVVKVDNLTLGLITSIMVAFRIFDAANDPFMGVIVDNTKTKFGKFKPWILIGAILSGIFTVLLFYDFGVKDTGFIIIFSIVYLLWGISFTANDISYWSMMPSLTTNQKHREVMGAVARIFANIGSFAVVVGIVPLTKMLGEQTGDMKSGYLVFAIAVVVIMWVGQSVTLFGVREPKGLFKQEERTTLKGMVTAIFKNDQLLVTAIAMLLFMIGYMTTVNFGIYFFKYAYGDEDMFSSFAVVLGASQLAALFLFPLISKFLKRKTLYAVATVLVVIGYIMFFFSPMDMTYLSISGLFLFFGQALIQLLMLMFLADSIEYGQWKLGKRNESVTFALQPFINKASGAIGGGILGLTLILSGINDAKTAAEVTPEGLMMMKVAMMILPLIFIVAGYLIYHFRYKLSEKFYGKIINDLQERGDISM